jgi:ankyrin repeat protein
MTTLALAFALMVFGPGSSLTDAIQSGNRTAALEMIAKGADVNAAESDGTTALHWAVHRDDVDLVEKLIKAGAKPNRKNDYGATPMSEAATVGNVAILQKLIDAGADVESPNMDGQTALMIVARTSNVAAARLLMNKGANPNRVEEYRNQTALMWAAAESQPEMVKELLAHKADANARSTVNAWERQVTAEPRAIARPAGGFTPLLYAARQGCVECAKLLVESGANKDMADPEGVTPMIMAVTNGRFDTAAYLLSAGANAELWDWWGRTPLYEAVDQNTLPHGGRPDLPSIDKITSLQMIELLLKAGVNPNPQLKLFPPYRAVGPDRGPDGMLTIGATPLLRAAKGLDAPAIKLLLEHGARVDIPNTRGNLPIQMAGGQGSRTGDTRGYYNTSDVQQRSIAALDALLKAGAKVDDGAAAGQSALRGAVTWGWNDVITYLAQHGANVNAPNAQGQTVLDSLTGARGGPTPAQRETIATLEKLGAKAGTPAAPAAGGGGARGGRGGRGQ